MQRVIVPYVRVREAPPAEPVSLADAKAWCRIDSDDTAQDGMVNLLIAAARARCEDLMGRALVTRKLELRLDDFPRSSDRAGRVIEIPMPPLISIDYVQYLDANGALQTMDASPSTWLEDTGGQPGRIEPLAQLCWPDTQCTVGSVRIGFTCGYAPAAGSPTDYGSNVPPVAKQWLQARISTWYDNRGHLDMERLAELPRDFVDGLLDGINANRGFA